MARLPKLGKEAVNTVISGKLVLVASDSAEDGHTELRVASG